MKRHSICLFLVLVVFWLLNSGYYGILLLSLGAVSICFVMFLAHRMEVVDNESQPIHLTPKIFNYHLWLAKNICLSSAAVLSQIWSRDQIISPAFKTIKISQQTDMGKVIYANSITLTPGTVAVDIQNDEILVHALDFRDLNALELGEMDARISLLER
ncbi:MAG: multicomponent Na+:H+ antiporter subunit E [Oceanospirillaceae bacterium]|jgi:multicomponent Na+:H+ antiporter subunit E